MPKYLSYFGIFIFCGKGVKVTLLLNEREHNFSRLNSVDWIFPHFMFSISNHKSWSFCVITSKGNSSSSRLRFVMSKSGGNFAPFCTSDRRYYYLWHSSIFFHYVNEFKILLEILNFSFKTLVVPYLR